MATSVEKKPPVSLDLSTPLLEDQGQPMKTCSEKVSDFTKQHVTAVGTTVLAAGVGAAVGASIGAVVGGVTLLAGVGAILGATIGIVGNAARPVLNRKTESPPIPSLTELSKMTEEGEKTLRTEK